MMHFDLDRLNVATELGGPPDVPLIMLHGAGTNLGVFGLLRAALAGARTTIAYDQPGHGASAGEPLGSIGDMAALAIGLVRGRRLQPSIVLGHSMGGAVAIEIARARQIDVSALIVCASGARFALSDEFMQQQAAFAAGTLPRAPNPAAFSPTASDDVRRRSWEVISATSAPAAFADYSALRAWSAEQYIDTIDCAALIVIGEDDYPFLRAQAERMATVMPRARLATIAGAGHMLPLERPAELAATIIDFLADL